MMSREWAGNGRSLFRGSDNRVVVSVAYSFRPGRQKLRHSNLTLDTSGLSKTDISGMHFHLGASPVGEVLAAVVQRRATLQPGLSRESVTAQPSDPARCKTIEAAATAAVSARRIRGPSDTFRHPRSLAAAASSLLIPPSGPISSETVSETAN